MTRLTPNDETPRVLLAHGGGGTLTHDLIAEHILPRLANPALSALGDSAVLANPGRPLCLTTDSFVVRPLQFPGGDIGRLAVCGTVNDLAVAAAEPLALTLSLVIEEGLPLATLDAVLDSLAAAAGEAGVSVVTGDTKVIEYTRGDGLIINTAGLGAARPGAKLSLDRAEPGDVLVVTGLLAEHGLAVMSAREGLGLSTDIRSDAAPLNGLVAAMLDSGADVKFLRDPTRGGLAGVLADLVDAGWGAEVREADLPVSPPCRHAAELLGLDPLTVANEGKVVAVVAERDAEKLLSACEAHPLGRQAVAIGHLTDAAPPLAELVTPFGGRRIVQRPYGEELPRIC